MRIGIFSTFIEPAALELVQTVKHAVKTGKIPNSEIAFTFSNRGRHESPITDAILNEFDHQEIPLIIFSAIRFKPELKTQAKREEKKGNTSLMQEWRNQFGDEVLKRLPPTDLDLLLGDMYIWGGNLCDKRNGINLHPALPDGPKGEWYNVIWELIRLRETETGVMMHKVTRELDRGPVISFCRFSIRGNKFDLLWKDLPRDSVQLENLLRKEGKKNGKTQYPLHKEIRRHGFLRENPLIIETLKAFAQNKISFSKKKLKTGSDLTRAVEKYVLSKSYRQKILSIK